MTPRPMTRGRYCLLLADQDDLRAREKIATIESAFVDPRVTRWLSAAVLIDDRGVSLGRSAWDSVGFGPKNQRMVRDGTGLRRLLQGRR